MQFDKFFLYSIIWLLIRASANGKNASHYENQWGKNEVNHLLNDISISARWMVKLRGNAYIFFFSLFCSISIVLNSIEKHCMWSGHLMEINCDWKKLIIFLMAIIQFSAIFNLFSSHFLYTAHDRKKQHQYNTIQYSTVEYSNSLNDFNGKVKRFGSVWNEQRINYIFVENYFRSIYLVVLSCCICSVLGPSRQSPFYIFCFYHTVNRKDLRNEQKMPFQLIISPFFR